MRLVFCLFLAITITQLSGCGIKPGTLETPSGEKMISQGLIHKNDNKNAQNIDI